MIKAYAKFVKKFPNSKFVIVNWSVDKERSKSLVEDLGISRNVIWITPVHKNKLIEYYDASDIVLEQFILGSWGASTLEAMSCGKPVLMFYNKNLILRAFGEEPPILNSFDEDEIYSNLIMLANDPEKRKDIGRKSREWIIKTHSPNIVAQRHLEIILNVNRK
jgi:glycosyltransferase involved in cell wall biosynthesis